MSKLQNLQDCLQKIDELDDLIYDTEFYRNQPYFKRELRNDLASVRMRIVKELEYHEQDLLYHMKRANNPLNPTAESAAG